MGTLSIIIAALELAIKYGPAIIGGVEAGIQVIEELKALTASTGTISIAQIEATLSKHGVNSDDVVTAMNQYAPEGNGHVDI